MNLLDLFVRLGVKDEASGQIGGISDKIKGGIGTAAKVAGAALAAAGAATVALGKQALDSYANYEQLEGGISKLFGTGGKTLEQYAQSVGMSVEEAAGKYEALNQAHDKVMQNAQNAYQTAGMSANQYMEQVSGLSAALVNSLGGDTVKAAEQADVAMRAISDNVNTFGTDIESVSTAYQGFAKQNYTMLDNLKLGYGGTKQEMERLIADANEWGAANGKASNLSIESFSDVVTAIEQIQEKQGIAGTTAREAATTIEGSVNMAKAAWQNWLTELGKDDADMQTRTTELVNSVTTAAQNIVPRVQEIFTALVAALPDALAQIGATLGPALMEMGTSLLETAGQLIEQLMGYLNEVDWASMVYNALTTIMNVLSEAAPSLLQIIPTLLDVVFQMILGVAQFLGENAGTIINGVVDLLVSVVDKIVEFAPQILEGAIQLFTGLVEALPEILPKVLEGIVHLIGTLLQTLVEHGPDLLAAAGKFLMSIVEALPEIVVALLAAIGQMLLQLFDAIGGAAGDLFNAAGEFFGGLLDGAGQKVEEFLDWVAHIPDHILEALGDLGQLLLDAGASIISGLWDGMTGAIKGMFDWVGGIADEIAKLKGPIPYDKKVLIENGQALMHGLRTGLRDTFEGDVLPYVEQMAGDMQAAFGDPSMTATMAAPTAATATQAAPSVSIVIKDTIIREEADVDRLLERAETLIARKTGGTVSWNGSYSMA